MKANIDKDNKKMKGMYGNPVTPSIKLIFITISALIKKLKPEPNKNFLAVSSFKSFI